MVLPRAVMTFPKARSLELATVFGAGVSLLTGVLIARIAGPAGRGEIVTIATWAQVLGWTAGLSIDKAMIARRDPGGPRHANVRVAVGVSMMLSVGTLVAGLSLFATGLFLDSLTLRAGLAVVVLGSVATDARAAALLTSDRWQAYALLRFSQPVIYLSGSALAAALTTSHPEAVVPAVVLALGTSVWLPALVIGGLPRLRASWPQPPDVREIYSFASAYHVGSVLFVVGSRIDLIVMPFLFTTRDIGSYSVASSAGQFVMLVGSANLMRALTGRVYPGRSVDRGGLAFVTLLATSIAASAEWIIPFMYGSAFGNVTVPTQLMCLVGVVVYVRQGLNGLLAGVGRPWATSIVNGSGPLTFVALLPIAETLSEVAAVSVASACVSLAMAWWLRRRTDRSVGRHSCRLESTQQR